MSRIALDIIEIISYNNGEREIFQIRRVTAVKCETKISRRVTAVKCETKTLGFHRR